MTATEERSGGEGRAELPASLLHFVDLFNRGAYWESHEALEDVWRETGSGFYHGLILYASAFVHAQRENRHGIEAQLRKAERALAPYAPAYLGLDVEEILAHGRRCRELVRRDRPATGLLVPFPRLRPDPALLRGDEPELSPPRPGSAS